MYFPISPALPEFGIQAQKGNDYTQTQLCWKEKKSTKANVLFTLCTVCFERKAKAQAGGVGELTCDADGGVVLVFSAELGAAGAGRDGGEEERGGWDSAGQEGGCK